MYALDSQLMDTELSSASRPWNKWVKLKRGADEVAWCCPWPFLGNEAVSGRKNKADFRREESYLEDDWEAWKQLLTYFLKNLHCKPIKDLQCVTKILMITKKNPPWENVIPSSCPISWEGINNFHLTQWIPQIYTYRWIQMYVYGLLFLIWSCVCRVYSILVLNNVTTHSILLSSSFFFSSQQFSEGHFFLYPSYIIKIVSSGGGREEAESFPLREGFSDVLCNLSSRGKSVSSLL